MHTSNQGLPKSFKVSCYSTKKIWVFETIYQMWPFFASFILMILQGLFSGGNDLTGVLLFLTFFICCCCVLISRFYANAILKISENELSLIKRGKTISYQWANISNVAFLIALNSYANAGIILVIYSNDSIEYIIIDSLYFVNAKSRANKIGSEIEKYLKGFKFSIQKSDFEPRMFFDKAGPPNILP